jgi:hypothetical protein
MGLALKNEQVQPRIGVERRGSNNELVLHLSDSQPGKGAITLALNLFAADAQAHFG